MAYSSLEGNLLDAKEGIIVHGCNAQGVMGSGVAAAIRSAYPGAYETYRRHYEQQGNRLGLGQIVWYTVSDAPGPKLAIANAVTQEFYGRDPHRVYVDYDAIRRVFEKVAVVARRAQIPVHYPKIGAGLANGDWAIIEPLIQTALEGVEHTLWLPSPEALAATPKSPRRRPR